MTRKDDMPAGARRAHIDLMNNYAEALDTCDWTLLATLFTEDAHFLAHNVKKARIPVGPDFSLHGREKLVAKIGAIIESCSATHHMMGNPIVAIGPDGVSGRASCYFRAHHAGAGERAHLFEESLGRFDFETVLEGSEWRIRRMEESIMIVLGTNDAFGERPD